MSVSVKCSKKSGEYCRIHNPVTRTIEERANFLKKKAFISELRANAEKNPKSRRAQRKLAELVCSDEDKLVLEEKRLKEEAAAASLKAKHDFMVENMHKNMRKTVDLKTFTTTVSIFRSGPPSPPVERGVEKESYMFADSVKPDGRQGRMTGVFASPTSNGVTRWFQGNDMVNLPDVGIRELRVNPDTTYVYSVHAWEVASGDMWRENEKLERMQKYWDSGITLTDWMSKAETEYMNPGDWEVLVSADDIKTVKPFSAKRLVDSVNNDYDKNQIFRILKKH